MLKLQTVSVTPPRNFVHFIKFIQPPDDPNEAYILDIQNANITIQAEDTAGAFYASKSLISLFETGDGTVQPSTIIDKPRYNLRSVCFKVRC